MEKMTFKRQMGMVTQKYGFLKTYLDIWTYKKAWIGWIKTNRDALSLATITDVVNWVKIKSILALAWSLLKYGEASGQSVPLSVFIQC